ncbi:MAG: acyltransferase [Gelidibacter sp.]
MSNHFGKLVESFLRPISGGIGRKLRYMYYRKKFKSCGENVIIDEGVYFENYHMISIGHNVWIDRNTIFLGGAFNATDRQFYQSGKSEIPWGMLSLANGVHIAPFSLIQSHGGVSIGENVTIASGSKIYSLSHHYRNLNDKEDKKRYSFSTMADKKDQFMIVGNVIIGDRAAIGLNSVLLPGTVVPEGTWIGVMSTLNSNDILTPNSIFHKK